MDFANDSIENNYCLQSFPWLLIYCRDDKKKIHSFGKLNTPDYHINYGYYYCLILTAAMRCRWVAASDVFSIGVYIYYTYIDKFFIIIYFRHWRAHVNGIKPGLAGTLLPVCFFIPVYFSRTSEPNPPHCQSRSIIQFYYIIRAANDMDVCADVESNSKPEFNLTLVDCQFTHRRRHECALLRLIVRRDISNRGRRGRNTKCVSNWQILFCRNYSTSSPVNTIYTYVRIHRTRV